MVPMKKSIKNNLGWRKLQPTGIMKRYLAILSVFLVVTTLIVTFSLASSTSSAQTANAAMNPVQSVNVARNETQFKFNIAYAYVGRGPTNSSYMAANGALMSLESQYPSTVEFNITRLPVQIASCDAEIEVYDVRIATSTGLIESDPYFIGTNYNASFSSAQLTILFTHAQDLITSQDFSTPLKGNFVFNMTENTSILSAPIGSAGCYSTNPSALGLWSAGKPNAVSVTVQRIGYVTITNNTVSLYKDPSGSSPAATVQLSSYENGFLHNNLVPAAKLPKTNLFHPSP